MGDGMKEYQFERKQRFSLRKYAMGACSVLLGTSLFFAGMNAQPVQATETSSKLISSHYLDEQDLSEKLKSELQWFEENKIEVKEGKEYYFVYRKLATRLPETGLFSNDGMFILGAGLLLLSFTLIKRKKGASYFLVTAFAVGGLGASISALENLVELQPVLVKRVEGQFLPSPETVQGYEFTGYYLVRDSASKELSVDKVESPALSQKEESSEPQSKKIVPQTTSHFSSTKDLVQSPQPSYAVEPVLNPTSEKSMNIESKKVPDEGMKTVIEDKPELEVRIGEIEFETQFQSDPTLAKGEKRISIEGAKGQERILTEVRVIDGVVTRNEVGREVLHEPVTQVILVGTKEKEPQENGISLAPEVQPALPSYEGGVSDEPEIQEALPEYKEDTQLPQTKVETKAVPYETIYEKNEALDHGVTRVKIPGVEGQEQVTTTYTKDQASGNISEHKTVKIVVNKVDQVVEVGTKPSVETTILSHKTIYQVNPALEFRKEEVAVAGSDGSVETRTNYQLDKATGQVTVSDTTRQVNPAVDKVIQVGNVEKVIQPIAVTEERREDSSLAKNIEKVVSEGEVGETTLTRTYAINEQTGELVNPQEAIQITKPMKPRVVLVGSQEDKPHLLPANNEREDAVDVSALTTSARSVDFLHDSKLKAQLEPTYDPRDITMRKLLLRKTHPNITDQEVKDMLRTEYLQKLSIQESFDQTKMQAESSFKKIASHTLGIIGDTPENRSKVKQELEQYKEQILLGLSYINRFYNIQLGDTNIRDILAFNPSSFGNKTMTALDSLKKLGSMSYEEMKLTNSPQTFTKYLSFKGLIINI